MELSPEMVADGWIELDGSRSIETAADRADFLFSNGEIGERCSIPLVGVAIGFEHVIAYKPEPLT